MNLKAKRAPQARLEITKEMIDSAIARDSSHCMIADSVKSTFPKARCISVDLATIRFSDPEKGLRYTYLTPRIAQVHIVNWDQGRATEPFSFMLRGAQVNRAGGGKMEGPKRSHGKREMTPLQKEALEKANLSRAEHAQADRVSLKEPGSNTNGEVPIRIGGKTPPLQMGKDNVPFSRRRAFGLRALEL